MERKPTPDILGAVLDSTIPSVPQAAPTRRTNELSPHPLNEEIYGDRADGDLIASVKAKGILNPILISPSNVIISGHRRWGAAIAIGLVDVPIVIFGSDDPLDVAEALIESNRQRQKTNEQIGREYRELKRLIAARESRQGARVDLTSSKDLLEVRKPPIEKAAEQLGISRPTATHIEAVVDRIDVLTAAGEGQKATALRQELERSANAAYNSVKREQRQAGRLFVPAVELPLPSSIAIHNEDARKMLHLEIDPVHLVITSPPYNVGIDYASHNDNLSEHEYLGLVYDVFTNCHALMVDGARIAVVVPFGVGRNPWLPLAAKIAGLLSDASFTLRGQIVWDKGSSGNRTTWGSFRLPTDPSLRDTTEAIIVAHKGSSKLEIPDSIKRLDDKGSHTTPLVDSDYFMELAQDHWVVAPESASRIGHPAPFPVGLAKRLIDFYAYPGAHILDPFGGSGTVALAAQQAGCSATLIEIDAHYCQMAKGRIRNG